MNDIEYKFFRLVTGDDIIAKVLDFSNDRFHLINAMKLLIDADMDNGKQTIYMHNWLPQYVAKNNTCYIDLKNILVCCEVEEDIKEYYASVVDDMIDYSKNVQKTSDALKTVKGDGKKVISIADAFNKNKDKN